ncbi:MAG: DUF6702 family protein [Flavobacteriales bacterium]
MRKLIVIILAFLSFGFTYHEFFVSITDGEYHETEATFQFTVKFIGHDLEKALELAGTPNLHLGETKELENANDYLSKYFNTKFAIKCNDKSIALKLIGKEVGKDDFIYCYIESEKIKKIKTIEITNTLLADVFTAQENIFYLQLYGKKYNYSFNAERKTFNIEL